MSSLTRTDHFYH